MKEYTCTITCTIEAENATEAAQLARKQLEERVRIIALPIRVKERVAEDLVWTYASLVEEVN